MEFRKGIIYAGLVPVVGGMMWVSIAPDASDSVHFWKKKQCEQYIRKNFSGEEKKYLLLFYASMGLGMLTKGLIAIAFPVGILFWYALCTRRPRLFLKLFYVYSLQRFRL